MFSNRPRCLFGRKSVGQFAESDPALRLHLVVDSPWWFRLTFDSAVRVDQKGESDPDPPCVYTSVDSPLIHLRFTLVDLIHLAGSSVNAV